MEHFIKGSCIMISHFGLNIILILIIISGVIAYIGNYIGRLIGRRRMTMFKLRPRHTAILFTVLTGILIALFTLLFMLLISRDARTALFGLDRLKNNLQEQTLLIEQNKLELAKINQELLKEKTELDKTKNAKKTLEEEIYYSRKGTVLFKVGDVLITSVIKAGPEKEKLELGLKNILSLADSFVRSLGVRSKKHLIYIDPRDFNTAISKLEKNDLETIVKVVAQQNTLFGEVVNVNFDIIENTLLFPKDVGISELEISPQLSQPEIEQQIKVLLAMAHQKAKQAGIIPGPSGLIGTIPYKDISSTAKKIKGYKKDVLVTVVAQKDIYMTGPLEIIFKLPTK